METNQPASPEKSDPTAASTNDEQGPSPARTYECTFCKRGFSNAQALGGHMNIHRKDKAKLKQAAITSSSKEQAPPLPQQFLEIAKTSPVLFPPTTANTMVNPTAVKDHERSRASAANWCWSFCSSQEDATSRSDHQLPVIGELKQLPLFGETTPPKLEDQKVSEKELLMSSRSDQGLDLELRLGHEPSESSSTTKGTTRKFF